MTTENLTKEQKKVIQLTNSLEELILANFKSHLYGITYLDDTDIEIKFKLHRIDKDVFIDDAIPYATGEFCVEYTNEKDKKTTFGTGVNYNSKKTFVPCGSSWGNSNDVTCEYEHKVHQYKNILPFAVQTFIQESDFQKQIDTIYELKS